MAVHPAHRDRKLHVTVSAGRWTLTIHVCRWHVGATSERLLSSSDGALAVETFRPGEARAAHWRSVDEVSYVLPDAGMAPADLARLAFARLGEPDVAAIHVVDEMKLERTFIRDCDGWLDVPRFPHPLYSVAPRA